MAVGQDDFRDRATELWEKAVRLQVLGELDEAEALYRESLDLHPTAEAHTYLGWTMSMRGDIDAAIDQCHQAISIDPDFGNPYNDIGAYLIQKGEIDEAIPWLERAKQAPRYEPRHFPYLNLGRIWASKGMISRAIQEFQSAISIEPRDARATRMMSRLRSMLN